MTSFILSLFLGPSTVYYVRFLRQYLATICDCSLFGVWIVNLTALISKYSLLFVNSPLPPHGATAPSWPGLPHCRGFTITLRHTTLGRTPLDGWSARLDNTQHSKETGIHAPGGIWTRNSSKRLQTHVWDRAVTVIAVSLNNNNNNNCYCCASFDIYLGNCSWKRKWIIQWTEGSTQQTRENIFVPYIFCRKYEIMIIMFMRYLCFVRCV